MPLHFMPASVNQLSTGCNKAPGLAFHFHKGKSGQIDDFWFLA
jgi:hypothetical protein